MGVGGFMAEVARHVASLIEAWLFTQHSFCCWHLHTQALRVGGRGLSGCSGVVVFPCNDGVENPEFHGLGYWSCFSWALSPAPCRCAFNSAGSICVFIS